MWFYKNYEEKILHILGIASVIIIAALLIVFLTKVALELIMWAIVISTIGVAIGGIYIGVCIIIDFDEKFGSK